MGSVESKYEESPYLNADTPSTVDKKALVQTMNTCMMMQMFRSTEYLCNITIKVADRVFSAHQTILACHSRAFKRLIQQEEKPNKQIFLRLNDIDPDTFQILLDYVYTGRISIDACNIMPISIAARKLEMDSVLKLCRNFITNMNIEEAMAIIEIEHNSPCNKVFRSAINYILYNYQKVYKHKLFDKLSVNKVNYLLSHDNLVVEWEIQVLDGILKWIYYDVVNRTKYFQRLVKTVRFHMMSGIELKILPLMSELTKGYYQNVLSNCPVIDSICKNGKLHRVTKCMECKPRKPEPRGIGLEKTRTGLNMDHFLQNRGNSMYKIPSKPVLWCFTSEARFLIRGLPPEYEDGIEKTVTWTGQPVRKSDDNPNKNQSLEAYTDWLLRTCDDLPPLPNQIERSLSVQHLNRGDGTESIRMMSSVTLNTDRRIRNMLVSSDDDNVGILKKFFKTEASTSGENGTGDFSAQTKINICKKFQQLPAERNISPKLEQLPAILGTSSKGDSNTIEKVERLLEDVNRICDKLNRVYSENPHMVLSNESLIEREKEANITTIEKVETILLNVQRMRQRATELGSESTVPAVSEDDQMNTTVELELKKAMPLCSCANTVTYSKNENPPQLDPPKNENCSELREKAERLLNDMDQICDKLKNRPENEETLITKAETNVEVNVTAASDATVNENDIKVTEIVQQLGDGKATESAVLSNKVSIEIAKPEERLAKKKVRKNPVVSVYVKASPKDVRHEIRWVTTKRRVDSGSETSDTESSNSTDVSEE